MSQGPSSDLIRLATSCNFGGNPTQVKGAKCETIEGKNSENEQEFNPSGEGESAGRNRIATEEFLAGAI